MKHVRSPKRWRGICSVAMMLAFLFDSWFMPIHSVTAGPLSAVGYSAANTILYVDVDAIGANNGTSWTNAFTDLQAALSAANPVTPDTVEIWVAEGTYKPTDGITRTLSFQLKNNVSLYGGFVGTETDRSQRNVAAYPTILSGDLQGNDTTNINPGDTSRADNSYHVVRDAGGTAVSTLDGFTITGGNANGSGDLNKGGGMFSTGTGIVVQNIIFKYNTALNNGAGLYNASGNPALDNVTFLVNRASYNGGGMYSTSTNAVSLTDVAFFGNAASNGAGLYVDGMALTLVNAVFSGNVADYDGGGIASNVALLTLINTTFSANTAISNQNSRGGGLANYIGNTAVIANTIFWGNQAPNDPLIYNEGTVTITYSLTQGGVYTGTGNISADPRFADADGGDNIRGTLDDDLRLRNTSPAIDAGDNEAVPLGVTTDLAGASRFVNHPLADTGHGTPPIVDMGAYEKGTSNQAPYMPNNPKPAHSAINVSPNTLFSWSGGDPDGDSVTYTVAFGTSSSPPDVVTTGTASYNPGTLSADTTYYWRITATDGVSTTVGPVWSFITASALPGSCILYPSTDTPKPLVDYGTLTSTLAVADGFTVGDVNVILNIGHTFVGDLTIALVAPDSSRVLLVNQVGGGDDNFVNTVLDDEADTNIASGTAPFTGYFRPYHPLSILDGKASSGDWKLVITDPYQGDTGTLYNWQLELCSMTTGNHAPRIPYNPIPANGATNVSTGATLYWSGGDPDGNPVTYTVAFGTSNPPPVVNPNVASTSYNPGPLVYNTPYYWQITATDGLSTTVGSIWSFKTATGPTVNHAPYEPDNPSPPDGANGVSNHATLAWSGGDPDGDFVTYTVAFGPSNPPPVVDTAVTVAQYDPGLLTYDLTYYWQITATDGLSTTIGPTWSFTTTLPPGDFGKIGPIDAAIGVSLSPTLSWGISSGAVSYEYCYTTTTFPNDVWTSTGAMTSVVLSGLDDDTTYYWQVRAVNAGGATEADGGTWWSFTTININDAPFFSSTPVTTAVESSPYIYTVTVNDPDLIWGDALTVTTPTLPAWLTLTKQGVVTATLTGTPSDTDVGDHAVVLHVIDSGGLTGTQEFTISVAYLNDAPFFTSTPVTTAMQGELYTYTVVADDPNLLLGDALTIAAQTLPAWLTLTKQGDVTATLTGKPADSDVGDHAVVLRVTDSGGLEDTQAFTITVANVNDAPFFTSTPVTSAKPGTLYTYTVIANDPDLIWGDLLTITAPTLPTWLALTKQGAVTATLSGTPASTDTGQHAVVLRVIDSGGLQGTQSFTITVSSRVYLPLVLRNKS